MKREHSEVSQVGWLLAGCWCSDSGSWVGDLVYLGLLIRKADLMQSGPFDPCSPGYSKQGPGTTARTLGCGWTLSSRCSDSLSLSRDKWQVEGSVLPPASSAPLCFYSLHFRFFFSNVSKSTEGAKTFLGFSSASHFSSPSGNRFH